MLDGDGVGVGVEIGESLKFRDPGAKNFVADRELPGLVIDVDDDVFAEILERNFRAEAASQSSRLCSPISQTRCRE